VLNYYNCRHAVEGVFNGLWANDTASLTYYVDLTNSYDSCMFNVSLNYLLPFATEVEPKPQQGLIELFYQVRFYRKHQFHSLWQNIFAFSVHFYAT